MAEELEILSKVEADQMMYELAELKVEFVKVYKNLESLMGFIDGEELYSTENYKASILQHLGHIAYMEKEIGKQGDISFSFKLDLYDEVFHSIQYPYDRENLPSLEELKSYMNEIHQTFIDDFKFFKNSAFLFVLINHFYHHIHQIVLISEKKEKLYENFEHSFKVCFKEEEGAKKFYLQVYAN